MSTIDTTEKRFESDIEAYFVTVERGHTKVTDKNDQKLGVYPGTLISFFERIRPTEAL